MFMHKDKQVNITLLSMNKTQLNKSMCDWQNFITCCSQNVKTQTRQFFFHWHLHNYMALTACLAFSNELTHNTLSLSIYEIVMYNEAAKMQLKSGQKQFLQLQLQHYTTQKLYISVCKIHHRHCWPTCCLESSLSDQGENKTNNTTINS